MTGHMMLAAEDPSSGEGSSDIKYAGALKRAFRGLNRFFMVPMWRLGFGGLLNSWPTVGGQIFVLVHRGRKSGRRYRTPLNYAEVDGMVYCLAGFGPGTDWYRNALAAGAVEAWLPDGWWDAVPTDVSEDSDRAALMRAVLIGSGFATYVAGIDPRRLSDEDLHDKTDGYRLLRLERTSARTGSGGPGDLSWIWPWSATLLAWLLLRRRRSS